MALLEVRDLRTWFRTRDGIARAVDGVSFSVERGRTLGIVGESGSGKSVTCLTLMGLNQQSLTLPPGESDLAGALEQNGRLAAVTSGEAMFDGIDLLRTSPRRLRRIRGNRIAMIFQDPMTSLNPVYKIGDQLVEAIRLHGDVTRRAARARSLELLKEVGIPRAERRIDDYPHEFSGGMRQRVMIAMGLANNPDLLIADEPTTALDVTTQAQILRLMARLQETYGSAIVLITHDLGVVAEVAHEVVVMYGGRVAERAEVDDLFAAPMHPYTWGLIGSMPRLDGDTERLVQIPGQPPSLLRMPSGCRFHPRCPHAFARCTEEQPELEPAPGAGHLQACFLDEAAKRRAAAEALAVHAAGAPHE